MVVSVIWSNLLSVGNDVIDHQHRHFFDTLNVISSLPDDADPDVINAAFDEICEYTGKHFELEEAILIDSKYCDIDCHMSEHGRIRKIIKMLNENRSFVSKAYIDLVLVTLADHIVNEDKKFLGHI